MNSQALYRLIYTSRITARIKEDNTIEEFRIILKKSQKNNEKDKITGFLVFDSVNFFQIIEGSRNVLWNLFQKIQKDNRHYSIILIEFAHCEQRQFTGWSMGGCLRTVITDHIFLRYGFIGPIENSEVKPENLIALAHDLMVVNQLKAHS